MYVVYRCTRDIPPFGVRKGDLLVQDHSDPVSPLSVVRQVPTPQVPRLYDHLDALEVIDQDPPVFSADPRQLLMRAVGLEPPTSPGRDPRE